MTLHIFNTETGTKEVLEPQEPGRLSIYVCGPTVYDFSHIGHARCYLAFDVIVRYLRRFFDVTYVRNFTDVDDKIIRRAQEQNEAPEVVSERFIEAFYEDMDALGVLRADIEPKVTESMPEIINLVQRLVDGEHAYVVDGDVYFSVRSFPQYGRLSGRVLDDMEAGARVGVDPRKRDPMDFALWKAAKPGEPTWDSPWGPGRPGWHIECSAMSAKHLGPSFDIHGGGKDLVFPHHENEIAQSEACSQRRLARYWAHNGFVTIDDEKMSKSLGNFFTIRDVLKKFSSVTLRYYLLTTHYRSPINFSDQALAETEARVKYLYETLERLEQALASGPRELDDVTALREPWVADIVSRFETHLNDDFNTARALGELSEVFRLINEIIAQPKDPLEDAATLLALRSALDEVGSVLGLFVGSPQPVLEDLASRRLSKHQVDPAEIEALIEERAQARLDKNFARADEIRDALLARGVVLKDTRQGTTWDVQ